MTLEGTHAFFILLLCTHVVTQQYNPVIHVHVNIHIHNSISGGLVLLSSYPLNHSLWSVSPLDAQFPGRVRLLRPHLLQ